MLNVAFVAVLIVASLLGITIIIQTVASFRRRGGDMPPDMLDGEMPGDDAAAGSYLGTFMKGWKSRFDPSGLLRKGPGKFWIDEKGVNFLVDYALQPVFIPYNRIHEAGLEEVPIGKNRGEEALVVSWRLKGISYRSAFVVSDADYQKMLATIRNSIAPTDVLTPHD